MTFSRILDEILIIEISKDQNGIGLKGLSS